MKRRSYFKTEVKYNLDEGLLDDLVDDIQNLENNPDDKEVIIDVNNKENELEEEEFDNNNNEELSNNLLKTISSFSDENGSKEFKELAKEILEENEGTSFDDKGNILDKEGKIIKSFEDLLKEVSEQKEDIFDEKGNLVDEDGKIIATKEELALENSQVNKLAKQFDLKDEEGNIKIYEDSDEGFKSLTEDVANQKANLTINEYFNSRPVLREIAKHLEAGKDISEFQKPIDYSSVNIKELTINQKRDYLRKSYEADGMSTDRASSIERNLSDDQIEKGTKEALDVLQNKENEKQALRSKEVEDLKIQEAEENNKYWEGVNQIVTKGDLNGFNIPEKDRTNFFNYMAIPVKDGMSQDQLDKKKNGLSSELKEAYYRFKGYDLSDIVKDNVNKTRTNNLRNRIKNTVELTGNKSNKSKDKQEVEISVDSLI